MRISFAEQVSQLDLAGLTITANPLLPSDLPCEEAVTQTLAGVWSDLFALFTDTVLEADAEDLKARLAFAGWEVSAADLWGKGGITSPGKQFAGFVSDDQRVVDALIKCLDEVRSNRSHGPVSNVAEAVGSSHPKVTMLIADDGRRPHHRRCSHRPQASEGRPHAGQ